MSVATSGSIVKNAEYPGAMDGKLEEIASNCNLYPISGLGGSLSIREVPGKNVAVPFKLRFSMPPCKARIPTLGGVINATGIETRTRMSKSGKQFLAASLENTRNSPSRGAPTLPQGSSACSGHVVLTSIVNGSPRNT